MFTGLVEGMAEVESLALKSGGAALTLKAGRTAGAVGDSISVNGVCLTVTETKGGRLSFDLSSETLKSSNLGALRPGAKVNVECALRADGRLGGHFVSGHVDGVGRIRGKSKAGDALKIELEAPPEVMKFLVEKGSVAVDGISLTVVDVLRDSFTVVIIPHTADATTIGMKGPGETVNLEADMIGKYVYKFLKGRGGEGLMRALEKGGFA